MSELLKHAALKPARRLLPAIESVATVSVADPAPDQKKQLAVMFAAELEALREEVRSDAYLKGYDNGKADAAADIAKLRLQLEQQHTEKLTALTEQTQQLNALFENMTSGYTAALADLEPAAVSIAFAALTQLLGHVDSYPKMLPVLVRHAIEQFGHEQALRICIADSDRELLRTAPELAAWLDRLEVDKQLTPASCIIEAGPRSLDASLLLQLAAIRQCLLTTCENRDHVRA